MSLTLILRSLPSPPHLQSVEALEVQDGVDVASARGISLKDSLGCKSRLRTTHVYWFMCWFAYYVCLTRGLK